jgi:hypothetical protein
MDFDEWLKIGLDEGFIGPPVCHTHDGLPASQEEEESFDQGDDICVHVLRLYYDAEHKDAIEENHSPSQWRKPRDLS